MKFIQIDNIYVIAGKCDSNGTCYAFSPILLGEQKIPHDFDSWELFDVLKLKR